MKIMFKNFIFDIVLKKILTALNLFYLQRNFEMQAVKTFYENNKLHLALLHTPKSTLDNKRN